MRHHLVRVVFLPPVDLSPCPTLSAIVSQLCPPHDHPYCCEAKMILQCWRRVAIPRRRTPDIIKVSARPIVMKLCSLQTIFLADLRMTLSLLRSTQFSNYDAASRPTVVQRFAGFTNAHIVTTCTI
jgi:hypothetical protein